MLPELPKGFSHPVKIGRGGFGDVYRARQIALNRLVALKFIHDQNPGNQKTLKSEAEMHAGLQINGIPQIYDVVVFSRKKICIIMQWVNGCDLKTFLKQGLSRENRITIVTEILKIVASLHKKGYAHRDIKPENILLSSEGVFLIDFGLTHNEGSGGSGNHKNVVRGTVSYIAPELWQGQENVSDLRCADVFSLGRVVSEILESDTLPLCVQNALSQDPKGRYTTAEKFLVDWLNLLNDEISSDWRKIATAVADELLAGQLLSGAEQLLKYGKKEESYQLLLESIQINPDNPIAIEMLEKFPGDNRGKPKKTTVKVISAISAAVCLVLSAVCYVMVKRQVVIPQKKQITDENRSLFITSDMSGLNSYNKSLPFKEPSSGITSISGCLRIDSHPESGSLHVDDVKNMRDTCKLNFMFPELAHKCIWINVDKNVVWKEVIRVLPFEEKRIWIKEQ